MTEKLRSGVSGKVREAIQQSVARILVGVDGSLTIVAKPGGLLGVEGFDDGGGKSLAVDVPPSPDGWKRGRLGYLSRGPIVTNRSPGSGERPAAALSALSIPPRF